MKYKPGRKQITWGITVFLTAVAVMIAYNFIFHGTKVSTTVAAVVRSLMGIVFGVIIAVILAPVLNFVEHRILKPVYKRFGIDITKDDCDKRRQVRTISVIITIVYFLTIIVAFIAIVLPQLLQSIQTIIRNFPIYIRNVNQFLDEAEAAFERNTGNNAEQAQMMQDALNEYLLKVNEYLRTNVIPGMGDLAGLIYSRVYAFLAGIINFIIGIIVAVYLLYSKETFTGQFKKIAYAFLDENAANEIIGAFRALLYTSLGFITGKIVDSIIIGFLCYILTSIIGTPFPVLVSVIVGITNVIPFFGPFFGAIIGSILVFMVNPLQAVYFILLVLVLQQFDGNILGPLILGNTTGLSSFWVLFAIMFFGGIWGVAGWVIGVPLFAVLFRLAKRIVYHCLKKKNLPTDTDVYLHAAYIEKGKITKLGDPGSDKFNAARPSSSWGKAFGISGLLERFKGCRKAEDSTKPYENSENGEKTE